MVAGRQNKDVEFMDTCVSITECSAACQLKQSIGMLQKQKKHRHQMHLIESFRLLQSKEVEIMFSHFGCHMQ